jgi:hypothetical protein
MIPAATNADSSGACGAELSSTSRPVPAWVASSRASSAWLDAGPAGTTSRPTAGCRTARRTSRVPTIAASSGDHSSLAFSSGTR